MSIQSFELRNLARIRHEKGFTMVELMVSVALAAVLISMAAPSFQDSMARNRVTSQINSFHVFIKLARSEAVKRNARVTMCASSNESTCGGSWADGWIVFVDMDGDRAVDAGDELVRVHSGLLGSDTLSWSGTAPASSLQFVGQGMTDSQAGTFTLCHQNNEVDMARGVIISNTGSTRKSTDSDSSGIHDDAAGTDLTCA